MSTKYFCDVCNMETTNKGALSEITVSGKYPKYFDVCSKCLTKMLKGVKAYHTNMKCTVSREGE